MSEAQLGGNFIEGLVKLSEDLARTMDILERRIRLVEEKLTAVCRLLDNFLTWGGKILVDHEQRIERLENFVEKAE